jgi:site-specific recombinase XerD
MKEIEELVKRYMPSEESMKMIDEIFTQRDGRYSDPWSHVTVAGFITHEAISITSETIANSKENKEIKVRGPQQKLKRIAVWLLKQRGFEVESFEKAFSGGIVDVIGRKDGKYILVECGPCRINKAIDYLSSENNILWILTEKPNAIVLYEIRRGEKWKSYFQYHEEEQMKSIQKNYEKAINELEPKLRRRKLPRILSSEEIASMFSASESIPRDNMLLKCMYYLGLKNNEARTLRTENIDTINSTVKVVQGKGKKDRYVPIPEGFSQELKAYIQGRSGFMFVGRGREGTLSDRHIRRIVKSHACTANIRKYGEVHPHTLRHSYATHLQNSGVPLNVIQGMLGHERIETTTIYTHMGIDKAREYINQAFIKPLPRAPKDFDKV